MKFSQNNRTSRSERLWDSHRGSNTPVSNKSAADAASNASNKSNKKSRARKVNYFYYVIRLYQELFAAYDESERTMANKRAALNMAISLKKSYYPDRLRFMQELLDEANVMLDSKRFNDSCEKFGLNPQAVAENLVLEGKANWLKVLKEGLENYGEKVMMFTERIYVDKHMLYAKSDDTITA